MEVGKIESVYPGVYWSLLDHPQSSLLGKLLDPDLPFVLCWGHTVGRYKWEPFELPIASPDRVESVWARHAQFDFLCATEQFLTWLPHLRSAINAVQLHRRPPDHLDLNKIKGKERWRVLGECGWHVLLSTPGNDFGEVASPHRAVVELAVTEDLGAS